MPLNEDLKMLTLIGIALTIGLIFGLSLVPMMAS